MTKNKFKLLEILANCKEAMSGKEIIELSDNELSVSSTYADLRKLDKEKLLSFKFRKVEDNNQAVKVFSITKLGKQAYDACKDKILNGGKQAERADFFVPLSKEDWYSSQITYLKSIKKDPDHFARYLRGLEILYGREFSNQIEGEIK